MSKLVAAAFVLILAVSMAGCVQTEETDDIIVEEFIVKEVQAPEVLIVVEPEPNVYVETPINKSNDFGVFETTLKSVGYYTHDGITEFRADIWVRNVDSQPTTFFWEDAYVLYPPHTYPVTFASFDSANLTEGESREGYILFGDAPLDMTGNVSVIIGNSVGYAAIMGIPMRFPHTYEIVLP